jgi:hypothetical protein
MHDRPGFSTHNLLTRMFMDRKDLKPTLLLALLLFLISAPSPDAQTVMEATQNFIQPAQEVGLQASVEARTATAESR